MKKQEPRITQIIWRDPKSTMSPEEYRIWKVRWDSFWTKLITESLQRIEEDRKKGIKFKHTPKNELVNRSLEMAQQLDIKLPGSFRALYYDDVYYIKEKLEYELKLKTREREGCKVIFEPPRMSTSVIIGRALETAKVHKTKGLKSFMMWQ